MVTVDSLRPEYNSSGQTLLPEVSSASEVGPRIIAVAGRTASSGWRAARRSKSKRCRIETVSAPGLPVRNALALTCA